MDYEATVEGLGITMGEGAEIPVVVLSVRSEVVPIFISRDQAQSIRHALDGEPFERPLTHDLFVEMIAEFGGAIDRVRIDGLADGTFLAKLDTEQYVAGERRERAFDARPSDGIAIALREGCPIRVSETVVDRAGRPPEEFELGSGEPAD